MPSEHSIDCHQLRDTLSRHTIFSLLETDELDRLIANMRPVSYGMGQIIVHEGECGDCAYLIHAGRVRIFQDGRDGRPITLGVLRSGELFGEHAILRESARTASARAAENVTLFRIERADFAALVASKPELQVYFDRFMDETAVINFLRLTTVLGAVPARQVMALLEQLEEVEFNAGDVIFNEGDAAGSMYILRTGAVDVTRRIGDANALLTRLAEGDCFGELGLVEDAPRAATVTATKLTTCFRLSRDWFSRLIQTAPKLERQIRDQIRAYRRDPTALYDSQPRDVLDTPDSSIVDGEHRDAPPREHHHHPGVWHRYPLVRQHDDMDCGAAALATVARYHGARLSLARLRELVNVGREGASMFNLVAGANTIGFQADARRLSFEQLTQSPEPVIAHWNGWHYLVVFRAGDNGVVVGDPAHGVLNLSRTEFLQGWSERVIALTPTERLLNTPQSPRIGYYLQPLLRSHYLLLVGLVFASLFVYIVGLAFPLFVQRVVDVVIIGNELSILSHLVIGIALVSVFLIAGVIVRHFFLGKLVSGVMLSMGMDLFDRLLFLRMPFFRARHASEILSRFDDISTVRQLLSTHICHVLDLSMVGIYLGVMATYDLRLTAVVGLFIPLYILHALFLSPILRRNNQTLFATCALLESLLSETMQGISTVKASRAEAFVRHKYRQLLQRVTRVRFHRAEITLVFGAITMTLKLCTGIVALGYGAHLVGSDELTMGELTAFMIMLVMILIPVGRLSHLWEGVQDALLSLDRIKDVYDASSEYAGAASSSSTNPVCPSSSGRVQIDDVSFRYSPDADFVLHTINLTIEPGQLVAIVGRPGSGRSTLISMLCGFVQPTSGRVMVGQHDLATASLQTVREQMGVVLQDNTIFSGTIHENIAISMPDAPLERVVAAAQLADADAFISRLDKGYNTPIGELGLHLSPDNRQRIAIARALFNAPPVLILDEATRLLDNESERAIFDNLRRARGQQSLIVAGHRLATLQHADIIVVLDGGMIVEQGTHSELVTSKGLYHFLYQREIQHG